MKTLPPPAVMLASLTLILGLGLGNPVSGADTMDGYRIGRLGKANIRYPDWFKRSFFDLQEDLQEAREAGKRGIMLFFSQKKCNHCQAFLDTTLQDPVVSKRVRDHYDVIAIDIFSDLELVRIDGSTTIIRDFAEELRARLTPSVIIYGVENKLLARIVGLYPPEKFGMVLDYIDGGHFRDTSLNTYLHARLSRKPAPGAKLDTDTELFANPPHRLDRSRNAAQRPLLVLFEAPDCRPCERFRERVLSSQEVRQGMKGFDAVQLNRLDDTSQLVTPGGEQLSPAAWARALELTYEYSVLFFDRNGTEVLRLDAETGHDRMTGVLQYVQEQAYERHQQILRWRREKARNKRK